MNRWHGLGYIVSFGLIFEVIKDYLWRDWTRGEGGCSFKSHLLLDGELHSVVYVPKSSGGAKIKEELKADLTNSFAFRFDLINDDLSGNGTLP